MYQKTYAFNNKRKNEEQLHNNKKHKIEENTSATAAVLAAPAPLPSTAASLPLPSSSAAKKNNLIFDENKVYIFASVIIFKYFIVKNLQAILILLSIEYRVLLEYYVTMLKFIM